MTAPLFIVGMPRSGTKLLRDVLSNHLKIDIPKIETDCLPGWFKKYNNYNFTNSVSFGEFYNEVINGGYFKYLKLQGSKVISEQEWFESINGNEISDVFEALIKHDVNFKKGNIWGDKSPSYIDSIGLIKDLYPNSRIILIVRDVRDYCLSIRNAWNKNIFRAAYRWVKSNQLAIQEIEKNKTDCLIIKYEDFITNTEFEVEKICKFMDIEFSREMIKLNRATENMGDGKGSNEIISTNFNKWRGKLSLAEIKKIEGISFQMMAYFNYKVETNDLKPYKITKPVMVYYKILDGINLVLSNDNSNKSLLWKFTFYMRQMIERN